MKPFLKHWTVSAAVGVPANGKRRSESVQSVSHYCLDEPWAKFLHEWLLLPHVVRPTNGGAKQAVSTLALHSVSPCVVGEDARQRHFAPIDGAWAEANGGRNNSIGYF